jgi:hypothetical protein
MNLSTIRRKRRPAAGCAAKNDCRSLPPEDEDRIMEEAAEFIPACVTAIAAYWRGSVDGWPAAAALLRLKQGRPQRPVPLRVRKEVQEMLRQGRLNTPSAVLSGCLYSRRWR